MNDSESPSGGSPEDEPPPSQPEEPPPPSQSESPPGGSPEEPPPPSHFEQEPPPSESQEGPPPSQSESPPGASPEEEPPRSDSEEEPPPFPPAEPPVSETPSTTGLAGLSALAVPDPSGPPSPSYAAGLEISYPGELNRWLPLVKWLLVIPHFIALIFVGIGAFFVLVYSFFVVLFTGRWPRGAFEYLVGTLRWAYRVIVYFHLMTDAYPPFSLGEHPDYPLRLNIDYPEHVDRWRPLVQWLLAIPYLWVAGVLYWLTGVMTFIAFFTVLFTKRIPQGVFELMVPGLRWTLRGDAYSYFMTDRYPPFVWG